MNNQPAPQTPTYRRSFSVPIHDVLVADDFWPPKLSVLRKVTTNDVFDKFDRDGAFANSDRAARDLSGGHKGAPWFSKLYRLLRDESGLVALAAETGVSKYHKTARRLWQDAVERKMVVTGGVGPVKEYEGFGYGCYLPSTGCIETCAGPNKN